MDGKNCTKFKKLKNKMFVGKKAKQAAKERRDKPAVAGPPTSRGKC